MRALTGIEVPLDSGPVRLTTAECWLIIRSFAAVNAAADPIGTPPSVYMRFVAGMQEVLRDAERQHTGQRGLSYEGGLTG
ncbi:hypothetical protein AYO47_03920 [Planctomyces sp. SCGC AG-212-M04]|nr:hypothetical protein AYO47_03920 [Planctomyces sp. SCGC AG-212-M04]